MGRKRACGPRAYGYSRWTAKFMRPFVSVMFSTVAELSIL
jgi:hypothetical protein